MAQVLLTPADAAGVSVVLGYSMYPVCLYVVAGLVSLGPPVDPTATATSSSLLAQRMDALYRDAVVPNETRAGRTNSGGPAGIGPAAEDPFNRSRGSGRVRMDEDDEWSLYQRATKELDNVPVDKAAKSPQRGKSAPAVSTKPDTVAVMNISGESGSKKEEALDLTGDSFADDSVTASASSQLTSSVSAATISNVGIASGSATSSLSKQPASVAGIALSHSATVASVLGTSAASSAVTASHRSLSASASPDAPGNSRKGGVRVTIQPRVRCGERDLQSIGGV